MPGSSSDQVAVLDVSPIAAPIPIMEATAVWMTRSREPQRHTGRVHPWS